MTRPSPTPNRPRSGAGGIRIAGAGSFLPERRLTNADLEKLMDTSDEWIVQRTGIRERRIADPLKGETTYTMSAQALRRAFAAAKTDPQDLAALIVAPVYAEMACPSTACR